MNVAEAREDMSQREIERAEAEDGEGVRGIGYEGIASDGEYRGNRIYREDDIAEFHRD